MALPEDFLQEVILRNPLEEIVGQYSSLKRAGSNLVCCCPFHNEKTPSFTLYSNPSHFYCYGCGVGGDVITFVRRMENLDYIAAVEYLANRAGLTMPQQVGYEKRVDRKRFYDMNAQAARFWHNYLLSPAGKVGLDYLTKRGLGLPIIKRFGLGYAPDGWDTLCQHLMKNGYKMAEIKEAFLGGISKKGTPFDYFRGRAMFPIIDPSGNVVAFSGRQIAPMKEGDRKYFNTNDTPVFKKSRTVFALNIAKNSPDKELILCEGNMDAVSLHAAGISSAVASLGTALTNEQCRLLARYTERVCLCYDADSAGKKATLKAIRLLQGAGLKVRVITLTGKNDKGEDVKDPDDFIRSFGKGAFDTLWKEAPGAIEYQFREILSRHEIDTMDGKDAFIKECTTLIAGDIGNVERELYINRISEITGIPSQIIRAGAGQSYARSARKEEKERIEKELRKTQGFGNRVNPDKAKFVSRAAKEENILGILLLRHEYLTDPKIRPLLKPSSFSCEFCRKVLEALLRATDGGEPFCPAALNEFFTAEELGEMDGMKGKREELGNNSTEILLELIQRLEEELKAKENENMPLSDRWLQDLKAKKTRKEN